MSKLIVAILFGGKSPEHNISLLSAKNVIEAMDKEKFEPILVFIDKNGVWHHNEGAIQLVNEDDAQKVAFAGKNNPVYLPQNADDNRLISMTTGETIAKIDLLYPVLHGNFGEDGSIQGFAKLVNLPCVGCGILGSAAGMDKDVTKRLLRDSGIGVAPFVTLRKGMNDDMPYSEVVSILGDELFIKPANLGSSVGVSFVTNEEEYNEAIVTAFRYDPKVLIETKVVGREVECAVKGNYQPKPSAIGEVIPKSSWYSFENKYVSTDGAFTAIPAELTDSEERNLQEVAVKTYQMLECRGLTRVDMFLSPDGSIIVNEVNTLPGFTKISMYPKLWAATGVSYKELITELINYAIDEHKLTTSLQLI
jgi:D-alanine-D-alanine ligase